MDYSLLLARALHVVLGVFWVGALVFNAFFLLPAMRDAGPDGAKVGAALMRRRFLDITPVIAIVTMLSGLWLYWRASVGFSPEYMRSGPGMTYALGGACAIIAFGLGVGVMRPAMLRAAAISQAASSMQASERDAEIAKAQALRMRAGKTGRLVAVLLLVTALTMSVGRYVI